MVILEKYRQLERDTIIKFTILTHTRTSYIGSILNETLKCSTCSAALKTKWYTFVAVAVVVIAVVIAVAVVVM